MPGPQGGWLRGVVKEVLSGDTVVVMAATKSGIPPEKRLTLSSLVAPRLGRRDGSTRDEPFAWQSREFLRKLAAGKPCVFRVDYTIEAAGGREFGTVFVNERDNIALASVAAGWARVRPSGGQQSPYYEDLVKAQETAESRGLGVFSPASDSISRSTVTSDEFDAAGFIQRHGKGKPLDAIVEAVITGSTLRVTLLPDLIPVTVMVAGIQCPGVGKKAPTHASSNASAPPTTAASAAAQGQDTPPDPFGREARHCTEVQCLNRDVKLILEGTSQFGVLVASIRIPPSSIIGGSGGAAPPKGSDDAAPVHYEDLATHLVKAGLAKITDWSLNMMSSGGFQLRDLERTARQQRTGLWHSYVSPAAGNASSSKLSDTFTGTVVEVVSGDVLIVRDALTCTERRVALSSLKAPRGPARDRAAEPWAAEAKEFLRQRLIGKEVNVSMEYTRKIPSSDPKGEDRLISFGTVTITEKSQSGSGQQQKSEKKVNNVAELLLVRGLAHVTKHRGDEERSAHYEDLFNAEEAGKKSKKGLFSAKEPPTPRINDVTTPGSSTRARQYLPFLQRAGTVTGIVEYVLGGSRLKIHIPKEGVTIAFSPSSIRCPPREDPLSAEALAFTRSIALQRDVELEVEAVDKAGTFLGELRIVSPSSSSNGNVGRKPAVSLSIALLERGLAMVRGNALTSSSITSTWNDELLAAQEKAKGAKLKIWEHYSDAALEEGNAGRDPGEIIGGTTASFNGGSGAGGRKKEITKIVVTDVLDANSFYVQIVQGGRSEWIAEQLNGMNLSDAALPLPNTLKVNSLCIAKFAVDNQWYRARVEKVDMSDPTTPVYDVYFLDFGNRDTVAAKNIRPMTPDMAAVPPQAHKASLANIKAPGLQDDYGVDAAQRLSQLIGGGRALRAVIEKRERTPALGQDAAGTSSTGKGWSGAAASAGTKTAAITPTATTSSMSLTVLVDGDTDDEDDEDILENEEEYTLDSINYILVQEGLARVVEPRQHHRSGHRSNHTLAHNEKTVAVLLEAQKEALKSHSGIWVYGDPGDEDDEDDGGFPSLHGGPKKR